MRITLQHRGLRSNDTMDSEVERRLLSRESRLRMDEATVTLSRQPEESPAYRVGIRIVTPGPDLAMEASGHTLPAALRRALALLDEKLDSRERRNTGLGRKGRRGPGALRRRMI